MLAVNHQEYSISKLFRFDMPLSFTEPLRVQSAKINILMVNS